MKFLALTLPRPSLVSEKPCSRPYNGVAQPWKDYRRPLLGKRACTGLKHRDFVEIGPAPCSMEKRYFFRHLDLAG